MKTKIIWNSNLIGNPVFYLAALRDTNHMWKINYIKRHFLLLQDVA